MLHASRALGMPVERIRERTRRREVASVRQVLMMLLRDQDYPLKVIAGLVGVSDHTTVIHGSRRAEHMIHIGQEPWASVYDRIVKSIEEEAP